ncbi:MAG: single-stranded DNA-binding protein [Flavobacteriales bacterium]|nr:single-stranded DNA-binding protein [Flavobacteriales bacterium]
MNALRNRVLLIGRLGQDPERVELNEDRVKVNLRIATNEVHRNTEGNKVETTQWHNVIAWGALAEIMAKYLSKGSEIAIEGRLVYRQFEDKLGVTRTVSEVVSTEMLMLDKAPVPA